MSESERATVTVQRAARMLGVTPQAVHYLIKRQRLTARQIIFGNRWLVDVASIQQLLDDKETLREADRDNGAT